jgi:maltose alpha-D-glucosyltransferase / alpha-amylase
VPNSRTTWEHAMDSLGRFFDRVRAAGATAPENVPGDTWALPSALPEPDSNLAALLGAFAESARLVGTRTAELHLALGAAATPADLAPEPFTPYYQRSLYQSMRNRAVENLGRLKSRLGTLSESQKALATKVVEQKDQILRALRTVTEIPINAMRIRCHGHYHLTQVLYTGKDFSVVDFEGDPGRPLSERRIKRSAFHDVATFIRSLHYVSHAALLHQIELGKLQTAGVGEMHAWCHVWYNSMSGLFLRSYLETVQKSGLLPKTVQERTILLRVNLLDKAIYELGLELEYRPEWLQIPIEGILSLTRAQKPS